MSLYRRFNQWKNRDYVSDLWNEEIDYFKVLEQIPVDLREKLFYADEKWARKSEQVQVILFLIIFGCGILIGWLVTSGYYEFVITLKSVLP